MDGEAREIMSQGPVANWYALPAPRPASYLPAPYGVRRDVTARFARLSPGWVYLSAAEPTGRPDAASATRAADFGHDNLAWSGKPLPRGRRRLVSAAVGGALLGAVAALLGVMLADRWAVFDYAPFRHLPLSHSAPAPVVAAPPEMVPAAALETASASAPAPASAPVLASAPPVAAVADRSGEPRPRASVADTHATPPLQPKPTKQPGTADAPGHEREALKPASASAARSHARAQPKAARPVDPPAASAHDVCGADWLCDDELRSLQIELKRWEAQNGLPETQESRPSGTSVHLTGHSRVTEW
jgi:hypothetical protein